MYKNGLAFTLKGVQEMSKKPSIRCYDNGGLTVDRYTVVFLDRPQRQRNMYEALGMAHDPSIYCEHVLASHGHYLGKPIKLEELPDDCRSIVQHEFEE